MDDVHRWIASERHEDRERGQKWTFRTRRRQQTVIINQRRTAGGSFVFAGLLLIVTSNSVALCSRTPCPPSPWNSPHNLRVMFTHDRVADNNTFVDVPQSSPKTRRLKRNLTKRQRRFPVDRLYLIRASQIFQDVFISRRFPSSRTTATTRCRSNAPTR